jgi:hypothetical protein
MYNEISSIVSTSESPSVRTTSFKLYVPFFTVVVNETSSASEPSLTTSLLAEEFDAVIVAESEICNLAVFADEDSTSLPLESDHLADTLNTNSLAELTFG